MKKLQCKDLGGPCDAEITGETFEEMGNSSKTHVMEQVAAGDESHKQAIERWKEMKPEDMQAQFAEFQKKFDEAEEV